MKKYFILIFCALLVSSCNDFLEEDQRSVATNENFYSTQNGLEFLITSAYVSNKMYYAKEEGYDFSEVATDTYTYGQQHSNRYQFTFSPDFNPFNGRLTVLWVEFYKAVNACNEALAALNNVDHPMDEALKAKRKAEVLFLRSHYFWVLTETWGAVPMPLTQTVGPVPNETKAQVKDVYLQISQDLDEAFNLLTETDNAAAADFGRVTKDAVRAFRSRINLAMGSYIKHAGNPFDFSGSADQYYTKALEDANTLINSGVYSFYSAYNDLWKFENNTSTRNREGIWAINYSRSSYAMLGVNLQEYVDYFPSGAKVYDEREGGHHGHMMWLTQYDFGAGSGMERDLLYGRPFRRYAPTKYLIDSYNSQIDARFNGQFRTSWIANSPKASDYPKWNEFKLPAGFTPPGGKLDAAVFKRGDTSMVITNKNFDEANIAPHNTRKDRFLFLNGASSHYIWDYDKLFTTDNIDNIKTGDHNFFLPLSKFEDPFRLAPNNTGSQNGARDAYVFRLAEIYLIAAEAAMELGQGGYQYMLKLANTRAINGATGTQLLSGYGINSDADVTINKLLDERAREFPGEQLRWYDLKRLHSPQAFVARLNSLNPDTKPNLKEHHYLRPIPQAQLDAIQNAGTAEGQFGQNPGY